MANKKGKGDGIIANKTTFGIFIFFCAVILIMAVIVFWPESQTGHSADYNNNEATTNVIDSDTVSIHKSNSAFGHPTAPYNLITKTGQTMMKIMTLMTIPTGMSQLLENHDQNIS